MIIRNITCDGGHGISIGSVRHGTIANVTFDTVTLNSGPTQNLYTSGGARIKSYPVKIVILSRFACCPSC